MPDVVPVTDDDLPGDDNSIPFVEVGGPRARSAPGPELIAPKVVPQASGPEVAFHLLAGDGRPSTSLPARELIAYHRPEHPAARQYRRMVDGVAGQYPAGRPPILLITAVSARSTGATVANMAVTRASDGLGRVIVIEAEHSDGSSAQCFGIPPSPGLREVLARAVPLALAVHRTSVDGVYILPAGLARLGMDEAARLPALLDQLRTRYDWILVDAPPWGTHVLSDWAKASDGVYLVLNPDEWDAPQVDAAHEGVERAGGRLRGCIIYREGTGAPMSSEPPVRVSAR
jgi:Mrp family chromosome partitioning ATPase